MIGYRKNDEKVLLLYVLAAAKEKCDVKRSLFGWLGVFFVFETTPVFAYGFGFYALIVLNLLATAFAVFAMLMQSRGKIKRLGILANATVKTSSGEGTTEPYIIKKKIGLTVYLILAIFGLSIVSQGIMQSDFNSFEAKTFSYSQSLPQEAREEQ